MYLNFTVETKNSLIFNTFEFFFFLRGGDDSLTKINKILNFTKIRVTVLGLSIVNI